MTAATAPAAVVGRATVAALARLESRYALRHPLLWLGATVAALVSWPPLLDGVAPPASGPSDPFLRLDWDVAPMALAAFVTATWAALRERPATTAELFSNTPARQWERTAGLLAAAAVPAGLAALVVVVRYGLLLRTDGVLLGVPPWTAASLPAPLELLGPPLATACAFVAGIALARLVRSRAAGAVVGLVWYSLPFIVPGLWVTAPFGLLAVSRSALTAADLGQSVSAAEAARWPAIAPPDGFVDGYVGMDRDLGLYGLHLVVVAGLTLVLAGVALARSGRDRRTRTVLLGGLAVVTIGVVVRLLVDDGTRHWTGLL